VPARSLTGASEHLDGRQAALQLMVSRHLTFTTQTSSTELHRTCAKMARRHGLTQAHGSLRGSNRVKPIPSINGRVSVRHRRPGTSERTVDALARRSEPSYHEVKHEGYIHA